MPKKNFRILVINPGSTSTKIAVFDNTKPIFEDAIEHSSAQLEQFNHIWDQYDFRKEVILNELVKNNISTDSLSAVVARGGLLQPIASGTYRIDQKVICDSREAKRGEHASNIGAILAYGIAWSLAIPSFIVDPPCVDEMQPLARFSGTSLIERESLLHALNVKAVARMVAEKLKKKLEGVNLIVAHLGGGITVSALEKGQIIDVTNGLSEGPFTPERAGSIPTLPLVDLCFSGKYTKQQIKSALIGKGGLVAYLGTNNASQVEEMIAEGNTKARLVYNAMAYQISKEIGSAASVLKGKVARIILTGGLARSKKIVSLIKERTSFIAPIVTIPGEHEMKALALGALRVLKGRESVKVYQQEKKSIGVLYWESLAEYDIAIHELEKILKHSGFKFRTSDENSEILYRNCQEREENLRQTIKDFLEEKVDLIYSIGSPVIPTVKRMLKGKDIPVVCVAVFDPVIMGLAKSYQSSETNICGTCYRTGIYEQLTKGLLKLIPRVKRLGIIYKIGEVASEIQYDEALKAAKELQIKLIPFVAYNEKQILDSIKFFKDKKVDAVFLPSDINFAQAKRDTILAISSKFPTLCALRSTIVKGGLVGWCSNFVGMCNRGAKMAVKVLSGTKPSDIPIERPLTGRLVLNLQTAKTLNLKIPKAVLKQTAEAFK